MKKTNDVKTKSSHNKVGPSETTREASFNFDLVLSKQSFDPFGFVHLFKEKKDTTFFEWFIGFTEGDGSFALTKEPTKYNPDNVRPTFQINQKDPQVLYRIRKELGFGNIILINDKKTGASYYRYSVNKLECLRYLILLFNGNLVLDKAQSRFSKWVTAYNTLCDQRDTPVLKNKQKNKIDTGNIDIGLDKAAFALQKLRFFNNFHQKIQVSCATPQINLNSAWLAGFTDAEGGFYASLSSNKRRSTGFRERYKFYIPQKGELKLLQRIDELVRTATLQKLFSPPKGWNSTERILSIPNKKDVYRLEIERLPSLEVLVDYFSKYPLLSKKRLVFERWKRVLIRRDALKNAALSSEKGMRRYKRLYASIGKIQANQAN